MRRSGFKRPQLERVRAPLTPVPKHLRRSACMGQAELTAAPKTFERASKSKTKAESEHLSRVAALGCILCRRFGFLDTPAEVHHIRSGTGGGQRASHMATLPLCPEHHRGDTGVHGLGTKGFTKHYGLTEFDLLDDVQRLLGINP